MVLKTCKIKCRRGVSLVGTMIAVAILLIALIGTSTFRYAAALDGRRADAHTTAARIALTLCESWRGVRGASTYNPTVLLGSGLQIAVGEGPVKPEDFTLLGSYTIKFVDDAGVNDYRATLSWKDVQPGLRALNVIVAWASRENADASTTKTSGATTDKSFGLTVYTQTL
jgi:Tfp pilus assembly protein PilV